MRSVSASLAGWGNYPVQPVSLFRPEKQNQIGAIVGDGGQPHYIARGLGRSYGDTALNRDAGVILQSRFNRMLSFDESSGVLECEAGVSLEEILECFVPRGYFLPVTPGTKFVTIGGAIANDVHGKNHHRDGTIADHILDFNLLTGTGEVLRCSREENADVFWATVGGIGLTGIILTVRLRLMRTTSSWITIDYRKTRDIEESLEALGATEDGHQYSVAWIDCLATGRSLGRSVVMLGNHAAFDSEKVPAGGVHAVAKNRKLTVPCYLPAWTLNPLSISAFNTAYYKLVPQGRRRVSYESFFYPLDSINHWNRMYGRRGFLQYQCVFPPGTSREGLVSVLERLTRARAASFLAVLKSFGPANGGLLSFPTRGYTLALDMPMTGDSVVGLLKELNGLVLKHGGRLYLAKDAIMDPDTFRAMYPRWKEFQAIRRRVDPDGRFSSSMARRLGIVEGV